MGNAFMTGTSENKPGVRELVGETQIVRATHSDIINNYHMCFANATIMPGLYQIEISGSIEAQHTGASGQNFNIGVPGPSNFLFSLYGKNFQGAPPTGGNYVVEQISGMSLATLWNVWFYTSVLNTNQPPSTTGNIVLQVTATVNLRNLNVNVKLWRVKI